MTSLPSMTTNRVNRGPSPIGRKIMSEVAEIAGRLSESNAMALRRHSHLHFYGSYGHGWPGKAGEPGSFCPDGLQLMELGLIEWNPNDRRDSRTRMTDKGRAVRAHLANDRREG